MAAYDICNGSYSLPYISVDCQSTVNMMIKMNELSGAKYMVGVPGLKPFIKCSGVCRGIFVDSKGDLFTIEGKDFVKYTNSYDNNGEKYLKRRVYGAIYTEKEKPNFECNGFQICVVDGENMYLHIYADDSFKQYKPDGWLGSETVSYLDGYFTFVEPNSQKFYISNLYDGKNINALDFASAESNPDDIVTSISAGGLLYLFGEQTIEIMTNSGEADFPFSKASGGSVSVGCIAKNSVKIINNNIFWIGRTKEGFGIVYSTPVGNLAPQRVSNFAVEGFIQKQVDIDKATSYVYQEDGDNFYAINFEEGNTTWVFELNTGLWHERRYLLKSGEETRHIVEDHVVFDNKHLVYAKNSDIIYVQSLNELSFDGEPIKKYRRSTQMKSDDLNRMNFSEFILDVQVGNLEIENPKIYLRYSNDGGNTWTNYLDKSLGEKGDYIKRVRWLRLGQARERVWEISCTDNIKLCIKGAYIK